MSSGQKSSATEHDEDPPRIKRRAVAVVGKTMWLFALAAVLIIALFVGVFPTRAFLDQREAIATTAEDIEATRVQIVTLEDRIDDFNDRQSVSRIARERFSLIYPNEELFRLSARPADAAQLPDSWMWPGFERLIKG